MKKAKEKPELFVETMCRLLAPVERKTVRVLGKKRANFFVSVYLDCVDIVAAIGKTYPEAQRLNLVHHATTGLLKELQWFQFYFVAGNYPVLKSRLRFNWEMVFRAHFIESYTQTDPKKPPTPGASLQAKLDWWDEHEKKLNWDFCLEPTLRKVFPLAEKEAEVRDHYKERMKGLHQYVHPSAYLADRMLGDSVLHIADSFDKEWAIDTLHTASVVFDLIWLAVLGFHTKAGDSLFSTGLLGDYPVVSGILKPDSRRAEEELNRRGV